MRTTAVSLEDFYASVARKPIDGQPSLRGTPFLSSLVWITENSPHQYSICVCAMGRSSEEGRPSDPWATVGPVGDLGGIAGDLCKITLTVGGSGEAERKTGT